SRPPADEKTRNRQGDGAEDTARDDERSHPVEPSRSRRHPDERQDGGAEAGAERHQQEGEACPEAVRRQGGVSPSPAAPPLPPPRRRAPRARAEAGPPPRRLRPTARSPTKASAGRTPPRPPRTQRARASVARSWHASMASAAPGRPHPKTNMKSGVHPIWRKSEVVDQIAGTRTFPSPRMTLSNMPPRNVIAAPPKRTRAKSVAWWCTTPVAPRAWKKAGAAICTTSPKASPI